MALYSFDSSAFIEPWRRHYPVAQFPTFWKRIKEKLSEGIVIASDEVRREIERKDDDLSTFIKENSSIFIPVDAAQIALVRTILKTHKKLVKKGSQKSQGDPFVIALAMARKATVVTFENFKSLDNPKIPDVCKDLGVPCQIGVVKFLAENNIVI